MKDGAGLGDAYGATLERIKAQGGEKTKLAMATLMWVCHAERPLQVDELRHALAVEIGETDFDSENAPSIGALLAVFSRVRGPRRARRGDCQEPWTGRDGKMRSTPVLETSGRPSLWRTAGPTR